MSNLGSLTNKDAVPPQSDALAIAVHWGLLQTVAVNLMRAEKKDSNLKLFKPLLITVKKLSSLP